MQTTLDLKEIVILFLHKWLIIVISCMLSAVLVFSISKFIISPKYTSSVSLYVNNSSDSATNNAVNINDITASQKLVNTYIVILQDDEVMQKLADRLIAECDAEALERLLPFSDVNGEKVLRPNVLRECIRMTSINNTEVLQIQAETKDANLSAQICTIMTQISPPILTRVVKAGSVEVIGMAKPADKKSSPNVAQNTIIGFLLGGIISTGVILLIYLMDNRIKDEEGLKKRFNIPILGEVPGFTTQTKEGYGYYDKTKKHN
ncbi:MAG: Wzz/FepE/Etk N-terminal domain-containing protein [Oscillospiraceae bacterium]